MIKKIIIGFAAFLGLLLLLVIGAFIIQPPAVLLVGHGAASELARSPDPDTNSCSGLWSLPIDASIPYLFPLYPELVATYWGFKYPMNQQGQPVAIHLEGEFPQSRYMSLHVYDGDSGYASDSLVDYQIEPSEGSVNPFRGNLNQASDSHNYEVLIQPHSSMTSTKSNQLHVPEDVVNAYLVLRIYRPNDGLGSLGGSALPRISSANANTGAPIIPCKHINVVPTSLKDKKRAEQRMATFEMLMQNQKERFELSAEEQISKGHISFLTKQPENTDLVPNLQMSYAFAPLYRDMGEVALVTMKAPGYSDGHAANGLDLTEELRYWSLCIGGTKETSTHDCLNDDTLKADENGMVGVIIGPDSEDIKQAAQDQGYGFMTWGWYLSDRLLIVRHLRNPEPFIGSLQLVPDFLYPNSHEIYEEFFTEGHIGKYAPLGRYCREEDLVAGQCKMERQ
jgi:hypothetical protein